MAEEWEERIHTAGSTFLGLTVAVPAVTTTSSTPSRRRDYYALAGVFASSRQTDRSLLPDTEAPAAAAARALLLKRQAE